MKKNSKIIIGTTSILATCALAFSVYEYQNKNNYNYNSTSNSEHITINNEKEKKDSVVIAEISEFGYAVVHGDHTHFKHGLIPYDAKFLDSVVYKNKDYKLNKNDILYEVEQGYIIKINNKYYYYPNENITQTNIITRELAEKITSNSHEAEHSNHQSSNQNIKRINSGVAGIDYATSDGFIFNNINQIIHKTANGIVVDHNGHSHYFSYEQLRGTRWENLVNNNAINNNFINSNYYNKNIDKHDDYTFDPKDIIAEDDTGYIVRHGDHTHYIWKNNNSLITKTENSIPITNKQNYNNDIIEKKKELSFAGIDYKTEDNYIFEENQIIKYTNLGLITNHSGHEHFIYYYQLVNSKWEHLIPKDKLIAAKNEYNKISRELIKNNNNNLNTDTLAATEKVNTEKNISQEIKEKMLYVADIYGVPIEAIKINDNYFVFNDPGHAYDPTHIHPYIVSISKLKIPEVTGIPEIDFENELLAIAERTNIPANKIKIQNGKFAIPHGNHDHFVKIKSTGYEDYIKNKIPDIIGEFITGELDKEIVFNKINELTNKTQEKFKNNPLQARRITRALNDLKDNINTLANNSTDGYLTMLSNFENKYILEQENLDSPNDDIVKLYNTILVKIRDLNVNNLNVNKESLLSKLNNYSLEKNMYELQKLDHYVDELKTFHLQLEPTSMSYTNYLLSQLENKNISNSLREEIAYLIKQTYEINTGISAEPINNLVERLVNAKLAIIDANNNPTKETRIDGDNYNQLKTLVAPDRNLLNNIEDFIKDISDFLSPVTTPNIKNNYNANNAENNDVNKEITVNSENAEDNNVNNDSINEVAETVATEPIAENKETEITENAHNNNVNIEINKEDENIENPPIDNTNETNNNVENSKIDADILILINKISTSRADLEKNTENIEFLTIFDSIVTGYETSYLSSEETLRGLQYLDKIFSKN